LNDTLANLPEGDENNVEEIVVTDDKNDLGDGEGHGSRFIQAVSYLIEWAKHIITIASALMILSIAILKDIVRGADPPVSYIIVGLLILFYLGMLTSIWLALRFVRQAATCVLTRGALGTPKEVDELQASLEHLQTLFLISLVFFSLLALFSLLSWAEGKGPTSP
jgi:hypothetical protein